MEISFYGGNFLGLPAGSIRRLLDLASHYVQNGQADGIRFSTRPETIDTEHLELIRPYAVRTIELGVQSMNDHVLDLNQRGHTARDTIQAIAQLADQPYRLGLQMMVGLPGDTPRKARHTANQLADFKPDFVRIYPTLVLEGSALADWYTRGRYTPMDLAQAVSLTKELYKIFQHRGIPVIRMGLQPTTELNSRTGVLAGPFHPAFGELVLSELWLDRLTQHFIEKDLAENTVLLQVHPKHLSALKGHKSHNIKRLLERFNLEGINVNSDPTLPSNTMQVNGRSCSLFKADATLQRSKREIQTMVKSPT